MEAQRRWRRLNGYRQIEKVIAGIIFEDGEEQQILDMAVREILKRSGGYSGERGSRREDVIFGRGSGVVSHVSDCSEGTGSDS